MIDAHDRPNLERDPAAHDAEAVEPGSTERDVAAVQAALSAYGAPSGPLLDIGCGTGRHLRALAAAGYAVVGLDLDERMLAEARAQGVPPNCELVQGDAAELQVGEERFAAALLLNRSLSCFHSHRLAWGLFQSVARALRPGGVFLMDNCCQALWGQVAAGLFADGLSEDGRQQLFFLPADNRFVWRRDDAVDPSSWSPKPDDRIFRLWSLSELALAGAGAGLELACVNADSDLICMRRPVAKQHERERKGD